MGHKGGGYKIQSRSFVALCENGLEYLDLGQQTIYAVDSTCFWLLVILLDSGLPHLHLISSLLFLLPKRNLSENENENLHHTIAACVSEADEITFSQGHQT